MMPWTQLRTNFPLKREGGIKREVETSKGGKKWWSQGLEVKDLSKLSDLEAQSNSFILFNNYCAPTILGTLNMIFICLSWESFNIWRFGGFWSLEELYKEDFGLGLRITQVPIQISRFPNQGWPGITKKRLEKVGDSAQIHR